MKNKIKIIIEEYQSNNKINIHDEFIDDLKKELSKFNSHEELLRNGGLSIELLDRLAFGFSEKDITTLNPKDLKIKWKTDYENVIWEINRSELTKKQWALNINITQPIDVSYMEYNKKIGFYIEDGHHRYVAAKILNKPLYVNLEIKINPLKIITPQLEYDNFHRYIFNLYAEK